jgi:hypothetical protein
MGFLSQLMGIFTGKKKQGATSTPSTPAITQPKSTTKPPSQDSSPDPVAPLESLPQRTVEQKLEQVTHELEAIAQQSPPIAEFSEQPEPSPSVEAPAMAEKIAAWGNSGQVRHIPQLLRSANAADPDIRAEVALALGKIAKVNPRRTEMQSAIPVLGKLSGDRSLAVSENAVKALGMIRSDQVKPYLQKALRHPSSKVSQAASVAIRQLKLQYSEQPEAHPIKPPVKNIPHHRF